MVKCYLICRNYDHRDLDRFTNYVYILFSRNVPTVYMTDIEQLDR